MKALIDQYAKFIREVREKKPDAFFTLFDGGKTFDEARNLSTHVFLSQVFPFADKYLSEDFDKMESLDIGYGSGFQVSLAGKYFKTAWGIDVHNEENWVIEKLTNAKLDPNKNLNLVNGAADNIPLSDNRVDFVHSWVTFLHFPSIEYTNMALKEIYRVLKPGGVAVIYYSRLVKTQKKETPKQYAADMKLEEQHEMGFEARESLTEVFKKGIGIARWKMTELVKVIGFEVLEHTSSNDGGFIYGQHGIVLRKPLIVEPSAEPETKVMKRLIRRKKSIKKT